MAITVSLFASVSQTPPSLQRVGYFSTRNPCVFGVLGICGLPPDRPAMTLVAFACGGSVVPEPLRSWARDSTREAPGPGPRLPHENPTPPKTAHSTLWPHKGNPALGERGDFCAKEKGSETYLFSPWEFPVQRSLLVPSLPYLGLDPDWSMRKFVLIGA